MTPLGTRETPGTPTCDVDAALRSGLVRPRAVGPLLGPQEMETRSGGGGGRHPLTRSEWQAAAELGRLLQDLRFAAGISQREAACRVALSVRHLRRLERGERRTRRSTLARIAASYAAAHPALGSQDHVLGQLLESGLEVVADESEYADRVATRRARRSQRASASWESKATAEVVGGEVVRLAAEWVDGDGQRRRRVNYRFLRDDGVVITVGVEQVPADLFAGMPLPKGW